MECQILKQIEVLSKNKFWVKELNIVRWYDKHDRLDIREWSHDHKYFKRGITLSNQEMFILKEAIDELYYSGQIRINEKGNDKSLNLIKTKMNTELIEKIITALVFQELFGDDQNEILKKIKKQFDTYKEILQGNAEIVSPDGFFRIDDVLKDVLEELIQRGD